MKWLTAIVAACIVALALASGSQRPWGWTASSTTDSDVAQRWVRFAQLVSLRRAATEARAQLAIARWSATDDARVSGITIDRSLPDSATSFVANAARAQLDSSGVSLDQRMLVHVSRPLWMPDSADTDAMKAPLGVTWLLPRDAAPCRALVELRDLREADLQVARHTSLLGPCAWFARFGAPGPRIRAWLDSARFSFATRPPAPIAAHVDSMSRRHERSALSMSGASCLMGNDRECRYLLGFEHPAAQARVPGDAWTLEPGYPVDLVVGHLASTYGQRFGAMEGRLLADLLAMGGEERFARFWTSPMAVDTAFVAAYGAPMAQWTRRWLALTYDDTPGGPRVPASAVWSALAAIALGVGSGSRGRGRTA